MKLLGEMAWEDFNFDTHTPQELQPDQQAEEREEGLQETHNQKETYIGALRRRYRDYIPTYHDHAIYHNRMHGEHGKGHRLGGSLDIRQPESSSALASTQIRRR